MTDVLIICPIPLVFRAVKRARELDGIEERWPYGDPHEKWPTERHKLMFSFIDTGNADIFYSHQTPWINPGACIYPLTKILISQESLSA